MDTVTGSGGGSIGTTYYYAEDFLGSSRAMVQAGQTSACFDADFLPFGREKDAAATCTQNAYKFEGKERDAETGNDDFGARYYSSNFGRWLSPDWSSTPEAVPYANLTNPQTLNLYAMVQDNPESFADLDGHVNTTATASQTVTCDVIDTQGCNYYQVGWIFAITNSPSDPASHDITALANKINLWSLPSWPYALTFTPKIAVAQCLHDIAKCQQAAEQSGIKAPPTNKPPIDPPDGKGPNGEPNEWEKLPSGRGDPHYEPAFKPKYPVPNGSQPRAWWDAKDGWWSSVDGRGGNTKHYDRWGNQINMQNTPSLVSRLAAIPPRPIAALGTAAIITYIIVSEGSRIYLPRNFVPVP